MDSLFGGGGGGGKKDPPKTEAKKEFVLDSKYSKKEVPATKGAYDPGEASKQEAAAGRPRRRGGGSAGPTKPTLDLDDDDKLFQGTSLAKSQPAPQQQQPMQQQPVPQQQYQPPPVQQQQFQPPPMQQQQVQPQTNPSQPSWLGGGSQPQQQPQEAKAVRKLSRASPVMAQ